MPKTHNTKPRMPAVTIQPGRRKLPRDVVSAQFSLIVKAGPYYHQACQRGQKALFYDRFFPLWFLIFPEIPDDHANIDFAHHRELVTQNRLRNKLCFAGAFIIKCNKQWEEWIVDKENAHCVKLRVHEEAKKVQEIEQKRRVKVHKRELIDKMKECKEIWRLQALIDNARLKASLPSIDHKNPRPRPCPIPKNERKNVGKKSGDSGSSKAVVVD